MTEQEVDYAVRVIRRNIHHEVPFEIAAADEELDRLAATLKSLIADGERIDWLEENSQFSTAWDAGPYIQINNPTTKTLRQVIDERRVQA